MKKTLSVICVLLAILIAASAIPLAFSDVYDSSFVNGDSEGSYEGALFYIDGGRACKSDLTFADKDFYTDYTVKSLAVSNGILYVNTGREIRSIAIPSKKDRAVYSSDSSIVKFSLWHNRIYLLENKKVNSVNLSGRDRQTVIENASDFWFDDNGVLSYMTDGEMIYSVNLNTDEASESVNMKSYIDSDITVPTTVDSKDGSSPCGYTLAQLRSKFPAGKYWNKVGKSSNNEDGYTSSPCPDHSSTKTCNCFSQWSSWQCMGFAYKLAWDISGTNAHYWNISYDKRSIDTVKAGDCIRYNNDGHTVFVIGVSGDSVTVAECNWGANCIIKWDRTISKQTLKNSFTWRRSSDTIVVQGGGDIHYTIAFNANGGNSPETSRSVAAGTPYGALPVPVREGYNFTGWYTTSTGGTLIDANSVCGSNITVYAHWEEKTYNIKYDPNSNGDDVRNMPRDQVKKHFSTLTLNISVDPTRTNYKFLYFCADRYGAGTQYTSRDKSFNVNEDTTLYAIWEGNEYNLKFIANGGNCDVSSKKVRFGSPLGELPVPTRTGYDFQGWYTKSDSGDRVTEATILDSVNLTVYAHWSTAQYTISYDSNGGGNVPSSQIKTYGQSIILNSAVPTRTGFSFVCYNTRPDGSGTNYMPGTAFYEEASTVLYAIWERDKYTITFNGNGGTGDTLTATKYYDIEITLPEGVFEKTGCDFVEWNTRPDGTGAGYAAGGRYNGNGSVTLYAIWDVAKYRISYIASGSDNGPQQDIKIYDEDIRLSTVIPSKEGFDFISWNTKQDGTGIDYMPGDNYTRNEHLTLYAKWDRHKYKVTYDRNGGDIGPGDGLKYYGIAMTISGFTPVRSGYTFLGWNTSRDGSGTKYDAYQTYLDNAPLTLYAQWSANRYTITFDAQGGNCDTRSSVYIYDTLYGTFPESSKTGYSFDGWYSAKNGGTRYEETDIVRITTGCVFYAHYTPIVYRITLNADGGACGTSSLNVTFNTEYGTLPVPVKQGYLFAGWFTSDGEQVSETSVLKTPSDLTLTAMWVSRKSTVIFDANGGRCDTKDAIVSYGDSYGTLPVPSKKGYEFNGWYTAKEGGTQITSDMTVSDVNTRTLYAHYSAVSYNVTFDTVGTFSVSYGECFGESLPSPASNRSVFCGWYTSSGECFTADTQYTYTQDITLVARYASVPTAEMTAKFVADGKTVAEVEIVNGTVEEPDVPSKAGFSGEWEAYTLTSSCVINAVYTPIEYKITITTPDGEQTGKYRYGDIIDYSAVVVSDGYMISEIPSDAPVTMPAGDVGAALSFAQITYCADFISGGKSAGATKYTVGAKSLNCPAVPDRKGYSGKWENYTIVPGGMTVFAEYTPVTYQMIFTADGVEAGRVDYTVESEDITPPDVPEKTGYTGIWESYSFPAGGCTVKAVYTPNTYTVYFLGAGEVSYVFGAESITPPAVPERAGYEGSWGEYTLDASNKYVSPVYTLITYYATFKANGETIAVVPFDVTYTGLEEPPIPLGGAVSAKWEPYTIKASDMTVNAIFTYSDVKILGYVSERTESYKTTITFLSQVDKAVPGAVIHWYVKYDGEEFKDVTPEGSSSYTVSQAKKSYEIMTKYYLGDEEIAHSETERVVIKNNLWERIKAFFKNIFSSLPTFTQN